MTLSIQMPGSPGQKRCAWWHWGADAGEVCIYQEQAGWQKDPHHATAGRVPQACCRVGRCWARRPGRRWGITSRQSMSTNFHPVWSTDKRISVRLSPDRMGPLGKPPASLALLPSRTSRRMRSYPSLFELQLRYEAIWVWSYTTFILIEAVVNRNLAVKTVWLGRVHSSWLLLDLADVLLRLPDSVDPSTCSRQVWCCHWPPCFYGLTLSRTVPACCTRPPCRKHHK